MIPKDLYGMENGIERTVSLIYKARNDGNFHSMGQQGRLTSSMGTHALKCIHWSEPFFIYIALKCCYLIRFLYSFKMMKRVFKLNRCLFDRLIDSL